MTTLDGKSRNNTHKKLNLDILTIILVGGRRGAAGGRRSPPAPARPGTGDRPRRPRAPLRARASGPEGYGLRGTRPRFAFGFFVTANSRVPDSRSAVSRCALPSR